MTLSNSQDCSDSTSRLILETGEHQGMIFPLRETVVSIGRGPDNSIQIIDSRLSRRHTVLILNDQRWFARDLGSKNGTQVTGETITGDRLLEHGDRIQIGDTAFTFEREGSASGTDTVSGMRVLEDEGIVVASKVMKLREELGNEDELSHFLEPGASDTGTLGILYQVSDAINSLMDLDELLDKILDLFQKYLAPDRAGILLYDDKYDILLPKMIRRPANNAEDIVISNSIITRAVKEQVAVLVSDAPRDLRFKASESIVIQRIHSAICAPLIYKDDLLGVIYLDRRNTAGNFKEKDLKLVTVIANQAAMAIANSKLHARLVERRTHERDFEIARSIQEHLLPTEMPVLPNFQIHGLSKPARMVGGDYFDIIPLADDRYVLAVADVAGKGVPAAILLSAIRTAVQIEVRSLAGNSLLEVVDRLNQMVCRDTSTSMFITMILGLLDARRRRFTYCNAGHVHPLLFHPDGRLDRLETGGCFLGILPGARYQEATVPLEPGAQLVSYTDGVTDLMNEARELYGHQRLIDLIKRHPSLPPKELCDKIELETGAFRGECEPFDDFTLLVLQSLM